MSRKLYFAGLGCGWGPAVLNSDNEISDIRSAVNGSNDATGYWIGGSTDLKEGFNLPLSYFSDFGFVVRDYYPDGSGNYIVGHGND